MRNAFGYPFPFSLFKACFEEGESQVRVESQNRCIFSKAQGSEEDTF